MFVLDQYYAIVVSSSGVSEWRAAPLGTFGFCFAQTRNSTRVTAIRLISKLVKRCARPIHRFFDRLSFTAEVADWVARLRRANRALNKLDIRGLESTRL